MFIRSVLSCVCVCSACLSQPKLWHLKTICDPYTDDAHTGRIHTLTSFYPELSWLVGSCHKSPILALGQWSLAARSPLRMSWLVTGWCYMYVFLDTQDYKNINEYTNDTVYFSVVNLEVLCFVDVFCLFGRRTSNRCFPVLGVRLTKPR
jgi:hypothetical protein